MFSGPIVGWSETSTGAHHAFLCTGGHMIDINTLNIIIGASGWTFTDAGAINDSGIIVGHAISPGMKVCYRIRTALLRAVRPATLASLVCSDL